MEIICSCFTGKMGEGTKYVTDHTADHLHDESNVRARVNTSNGITFRHILLFRVTELCVTCPSVSVTESI